MPLGIASYGTLAIAVLAVGYVYLWFYNTEMALRITGAVFTVIGRLAMAVFKIIYAVFEGIINLVSRMFSRK